MLDCFPCSKYVYALYIGFLKNVSVWEKYRYWKMEAI